MTTLLNEKEVLELATSIEAGFGVFRQELRKFDELYGLYRLPKLPKSIHRGNQINVLSPDLMDAEKTITSDILPMITEITVTPLARDVRGVVPEADKKKADALEHAHALILDKLDRDRRLSKPVIFNQLTAVAIVGLRTKEIDLPVKQGMSAQEYARSQRDYEQTRFMWEAEDFDPYTCAWTEKGGLPTKMMRRYRQVISEVQGTYSRSRQGDGSRTGDLAFDNGKWNVEPISDDYRITESHTTGRFNVGGFSLGQKKIREVEMIWLADEEYCYHLAMNGDGKSGMLVWSGPHYQGRCPAYIIGGHVTARRRPEDRYLPHLFELGVVTEGINNIRTLWATNARNQADQHAYAPLDPEIIKALGAAGKELPTHVSWSANGEVPYVATKEILERAVPDGAGLQLLAVDLKSDRDRFRPQGLNALSDPELLKQSTLGAFLHAGETAERMLGPLVTAKDVGFRQMLEAIEHAIPYFKGEYGKFMLTSGGGSSPYAAASSRQKGNKAGAFVLDSEAIDFPHQISLSTRSTTLGQSAARYEFAATKRANGDGTNEDVWAAADISDVEEFVTQKAKEEIVNDPQLVAWRRQQVVEKVMQELQLSRGIQIAPPMADQTGQPPAPPPGAPKPPAGAPRSALSGSTTNAPNVAGPPSGANPVTTTGGGTG